MRQNDHHRALSTKEADFLEQCYKTEYKRLYSYASAVLGSSSLAEVAVQETFVAAMQRIETLMQHENPVGWLFVALKHVIQSIRRDQAELEFHTIPEEEAPPLTTQMEEPAELDMTDPDLALLRRFYVDNYSLAELAKEQGTTVGALKMRISRLKKKLRQDPKILALKEFYD